MCSGLLAIALAAAICLAEIKRSLSMVIVLCIVTKGICAKHSYFGHYAFVPPPFLKGEMAGSG
jgi:hypothetical protein